MIPTMIISFLIVGAMFFLTANEGTKSHHETKESVVVETKKVANVVSQKEKSVEVVEAKKVKKEAIVVVKTPKISSQVKENVVPTAKKIKVALLSQKDNATKAETSVLKVETVQKKIKVENSQPKTSQTDILPTIPTVPKVKKYEIKIPVPEKSLTPVNVTEMKN